MRTIHPPLRVLLLLTAALLVLTGCVVPVPTQLPPMPGEEAQIPQEAQEYIELSRADLAEQLNVAPDTIELESITEPAEEDGVYIVVLRADGETYTYHGREGETLLVSDPLPLAPEAGAETPVAEEGAAEVPVEAPATALLEGRWEGALTVAGMELAIAVTFTQQDDLLTGVIDIPQQGATDIPLHDIAFDAPNVHFEMLAGPQLAVFQGEVSEDTIAGAFLQSGVEGTFALTRSEQVAVPPAPEGDQAFYEDPEGLFAVPVPTNWTVEEEENYGLLVSPDGGIQVYVLAVPADTVEEGIAAAWDIVDPGFALETEQVQDAPPSIPGVEQTVAITYDTENEDRIVVAGGDLLEDIVYVQLIDAELIPFQQRLSQVQIIGTGWTIAALEETDLTGVAPLPISEEMLADLEEYIVTQMDEFQIPGAVVAIVRDDEVVYAEGFGTRGPDSDEPITPQTHFMIGSTGKTLTTMLMATLVDAGLMDWDTPVVEILPQFAVADPELTQQLTVRNLVCACTGVPRRDAQLMFNAFETTAEDVVEELALYQFFTDFGEAFQYSNQMVGTAGYAAGAAAGGEWGNLFEAYVTALQERVLDPIEMTHTTLSFEEVLERGDYAIPHAINLDVEYYPIPLETEMLLLPIAPAGAHWSTAEDMARYLITELNTGVAPDGDRVVSAENLSETWEPQVAVTADASYGLGWFVDQYKGLRLLYHGGNTFGFTSDLAFLPDADVGILVLTNARASNAFNESVRFRLFELLYDQEPEFDAQAQFAMEQLRQQFGQVTEALGDEIDSDFITPYLGLYSSTALGEITVTLEDGTLLLDAGEFQSTLRPHEGEDADTGEYVIFDGLLAGTPIQFETNEEGDRTIVLGAGVDEYVFEQMETAD